MLMRKTAKAAIAIIVCGMAIAALFISGRLAVNTTPSVPVGLWLLSDSPVKHGDYVLVEIEAFAGYEQFRNYPIKKTSWGVNARFLKRVAGVAGDTIERSGDATYINRVPVPFSDVISMDRAGNVLPVFPLPVKLGENDVWLVSNIARGFDSRYLGFADVRRCRKATPLLVFRQNNSQKIINGKMKARKTG